MNMASNETGQTAEKCKKLPGAKLQLCAAALHSTREDFTCVQTLRNMETGKSRQRWQWSRASAPRRSCTARGAAPPSTRGRLSSRLP